MQPAAMADRHSACLLADAPHIDGDPDSEDFGIYWLRHQPIQARHLVSGTTTLGHLTSRKLQAKDALHTGRDA